MYDIIELNGKKVAELREIATKLDIKRVDKLKKQDLVYAILDEQALRPQESKSSKPAKSDRQKTVPKKRAKEETTDKKADKNPEEKKERRNMRDRRDKRRKEETFEEKKEAESDNKSDKRVTKRDDKRDDKGERENRRDNRRDRNERGERNDRGDRNNRNRNNQRRDKHDRFISDPEEHGYNFDNLVEIEGVLEVQQEGHGILRSADYNYLNSPDDVYVSPKQMKQFSIQNGDTVVAGIRPPRIGEKFYPLISVKSVNGRTLGWIRDRVPFKYLTPLFPQEKFKLSNSRSNTSMRLMDLFSPIGKGQRGMIVSQPKTGKTTLLKDLANSISINHPEVYLIILLIDERPEEVTDMKRSVNGEVIASTFDEPADRHVRIANLVLEKAKRMVECGHDV
ncbi:MAG: transcription termination factor Rho, partial [Crocinitomicaceae bacterium]|nr:transcription termination factor Rho [Crocinitomicaceae bacterium]